MNNCDFEQDNSFSKKCQFAWNKYYTSKEFLDKLRILRKRGTINISKIDRSENVLFQKESYLDVVISLDCGSSLKIDEKAQRYPPKKMEYLDSVCIEVVSNPTKNGKHDGWGYHIGTTICVAYFDTQTFEMKTQPIIFTITNDFIEEIVRNNDYPLLMNKYTNGLYASFFKPVPKKIIEKYFP